MCRGLDAIRPEKQTRSGGASFDLPIAFWNRVTTLNGRDSALFVNSVASYSGSSFAGSSFEVGFAGGGTEIIAVPEPEAYLTATALLIGLGIHLLRQRKRRAVQAR